MSTTETTKPKTSKTTYKILANTTGKTWVEVGEMKAPGGDAALKAFLAGPTPAADATAAAETRRYVAVPLRSWHPRAVRDETKTVSKLVAA